MRLLPFALLGALTVAGTAGCRREAPGPAECQALALSAAGVAERDPADAPERLARIDALTRECLVTPYDRLFVRCMEETRHLPGCRRAFARRRAERTAGR